MFDTTVVAKKIKEVRMSRNMTQMDLADAMGVSYQAVSNWERGNSMPDIAKIPDLCRVLDISFDELVGDSKKEAATIKKVLDDENAKVTVEELSDVAPMLPPKKFKKLVDKISGDESKIDVKTLVTLAPFLDDEELAELFEKVGTTDVRDVVGLAPFLPKDALDRFVDQYLADENANCDKCVCLAPFLAPETINKIVVRIMKSGKAKHITAWAPFM